MSDVYVVVMEGMTEAIAQSTKLSDGIRTAASRAVNRTTERARTAAARAIRLQVALPASYVDPATKRLSITKHASESDLEAVITGRRRETSLARFIRSNTRKGIKVEVKPGVARYLTERAFVIKLRRGESELGNIGLAVRTDGPPPQGAYKPRQLDKNLWLLYGPSVAQVFDGVRDEIAPETADFLEQEFWRQMNLKG